MVRFLGLVVVCGLTCGSLGAADMDFAETGAHGSSGFSDLARVLEEQQKTAERDRKAPASRDPKQQKQPIKVTVWGTSSGAAGFHVDSKL